MEPSVSQLSQLFQGYATEVIYAEIQWLSHRKSVKRRPSLIAYIHKGCNILRPFTTSFMTGFQPLHGNMQAVKEILIFVGCWQIAVRVVCLIPTF